MKFQIVDAFTRQTFGGNPAGVVLLPEWADFPADETMRKTAAELRYSETAFIKPLGGNRFHIRYFTPAAEVERPRHHRQLPRSAGDGTGSRGRHLHR